MGVCNSVAEVSGGAVSKKGSKKMRYGQVMNANILEAIRKLPQGKNVIAEYVWIDGQAMQKAELQSEGVRSKQRTLPVSKITSLS